MKVKLIGRKKAFFSSKDEEYEIGSFKVVIKSMATEDVNEKPQFFNVINSQGQFVGQILANFHVRFFS